MIEFEVEDILFGAAVGQSAAPAAPEEEAATARRSLILLPSMTVDPADTKTPYSDATQVGRRREEGCFRVVMDVLRN